MRQLLSTCDKQLLQKLCHEHHFVNRGNTYFRIHGDFVLQAIRFNYERLFNCFSLNIGVISLYSKASTDFFTSRSSIPKYSICCLDGCARAVSLISEGSRVAVSIKSPREQIRLLENKGFAFLDSIQQQVDIVEAISTLDCATYGNVLWHDARKLAPLLASGMFDDANLVLSSILNQHLGPASFSSPPWTKENYERYVELYPGKDEMFLSIHRMLIDNDTEKIYACLNKNLYENLSKLKFITKHGCKP